MDRVDLKTKSTTTVFKKNPLIPNPKALCVYDGKLFVADSNLPNIFQIAINDHVPIESGVTYNCVSTGNKVQAMTGCDGSVYALQAGTTPLICVWPNPRAVQIATAWRFFASTDNAQAEPLVSCGDGYYGFAATPKQPLKLYISGMGYSIISVKDYDFGECWNGGSPADFRYPTTKPPKTFRILVVGDSRVVTAPRTNEKGISDGGSYLIDTYAKQMELYLNMEAALKNVDTHFEVLILSHMDENSLFFSNFDAPILAKKFDIDMVMPLASLNYRDYYLRPLTSEGIPGKDRDPEYALKPIESRIPPGPAGRFYQICKQKKYMNDSNSIIDYDLLSHVTEPDIRENMMEMYGLPMRLLNDKLKAVKLSNGSSPKLVISYVPWDNLPGNPEDFENFFKELCQKNNVPIVSIVSEFNVLRTGFYPTQQQCCSHHFTAYGNQLIAYLLTHALIDQKVIPFEPLKNN
jgi:hypothetical protein